MDNLKQYHQYQEIKLMLKDDRSKSYIARKLGYKNVSSIDNIVKRFKWTDAITKPTEPSAITFDGQAYQHSCGFSTPSCQLASLHYQMETA